MEERVGNYGDSIEDGEAEKVVVELADVMEVDNAEEYGMGGEVEYDVGENLSVKEIFTRNEVFDLMAELERKRVSGAAGTSRIKYRKAEKGKMLMDISEEAKLVRKRLERERVERERPVKERMVNEQRVMAERTRFELSLERRIEDLETQSLLSQAEEKEKERTVRLYRERVTYITAEVGVLRMKRSQMIATRQKLEEEREKLKILEVQVAGDSTTPVAS